MLGNERVARIFVGFFTALWMYRAGSFWRESDLSVLLHLDPTKCTTFTI
jgi:hypothetical protein